ncbi:MAG: SynChlorMet cassette protein ScmC [Deltaproteobacteria bacterium]|nr:SynChlorMet cassette protein ScmC [Deltaproteobacteria bacterium]
MAEDLDIKAGSKSAQQAFHLCLSDGNSWSLTGDPQNAGLVDRLASIMELKECASTSSPRFIFSSNGNTKVGSERAINLLVPETSSSRNRNGWHFYDHNTIRIWHHDDFADVICEVKVNKGREIELINMWFALHPVYQLSISKGGLPFHGGLVERAGQGFLLVASGGTGKSTCCARLPENWRPLCDDESLVVLTEENKYQAHPFPTWSDYLWQESDKTWNVEYSVPLQSIFFLEQSEADTVEPLGEGRAAVLMTESAAQICEKFWRNLAEEDKKKRRKELFDNACEMVKSIPVYRLKMSLEGRFWEKMEEVIRF